MAGLLANLDALVYGLLIFASLLGWGALLARLLFPGRAVEWGMKAAWGTALTVAVGGLLDLLHAISRTTILAYLAIGLLLLVLTIGQWLMARRSAVPGPIGLRGHRIAFILCGILVLIVIAQYATWVVDGTFNIHDDLHGYLVFPQKMLQTGSEGADPYSERRIETSLGGQWFLLAIALAHVPEPYVHLIDPGLGILLLAALVCGGFRQGASWLMINASLAFIIFLKPPVTNVSTVVIGAALFLALFRTVAWIEGFPAAPLRNAIIVSLLAAALMSGKSTLVPACGAFLVLSYLARIIQSSDRKKAITEAALAVVISLLLLLPWMISMYRSCNTLFYPFLGKGYHAARYGLYEPSSSALSNRGYLLRSIIAILVSREMISLGLLLGAAWIAGLLRFRQRNILLPMVISVAAGLLTIYVGGGGYGAIRYDIPFLFAAMLILLREIFRAFDAGENSSAPTNAMLALVCLATGVWIGGESAFQIALRLQSAGTALKMASSGSPVNADLRSPELEKRYAAMQNSIPAGEILICRLEKPYLLNFKRNRVFIVDYPGGQSPPPGMPFFKGSEALADYLTAQDLRYLAYSYATQAAFSRETFKERIGPDAHPWIRSEAKCTFDFQDNVDELRKSRKTLYDDGDICVIDLALRK